MTVKVLYFAWVRERIGKTDEIVEPPRGVDTVEQFVTWLAGHGEEYAHAFANPRVIRVALDHVHAEPGASIAGAREIALFPPMTGG